MGGDTVPTCSTVACTKRQLPASAGQAKTVNAGTHMSHKVDYHMSMRNRQLYTYTEMAPRKKDKLPSPAQTASGSNGEPWIDA